MQSRLVELQGVTGFDWKLISVAGSRAKPYSITFREFTQPSYILHLVLNIGTVQKHFYLWLDVEVLFPFSKKKTLWTNSHFLDK